MSVLYSMDWSHTEEKLSVYDGKKITHKPSKATADTVIVAENVPLKIARPFLEAGATILRCSPNASAEYREKYAYPKTDDNDAIIIWWLYQASPDKFRPMKMPSKLRELYTNYEQLTKQIVATKNRLWASEDVDNQAYLDVLEDAKALLLKAIQRELKKMPIYTEFLSKIKGIGPALASGLVAEVGDISRAIASHCDGSPITKRSMPTKCSLVQLAFCDMRRKMAGLGQPVYACRAVVTDAIFARVPRSASVRSKEKPSLPMHALALAVKV